jgi:hypothetical protein
MTPHFIPIYGSSILAIGVLALFAGHNRKTGWKRQRGKFAQWLNEFYEGAYVDGVASESVFRETSRPVVTAWTPLTDSEVIGFSQQLIKLRSSLGAAGTSPVFEAPRATREMIRQ